MPRSVGATRGRLSRAGLEAVLVIVRLAYEGLVQREAWGEMLRQTRELFRARDVFLVRTPVTSASTPMLMADGVDPALQSIYSNRFAVPLTNPTITAAMRLGLEGTIVTSDLIPWQEMEKTEFFNAIRRPRGVRWEIGACGSLVSESRRYLTANRMPLSPRFASREEALMDQLWPHLDRVLKLDDEAARKTAEIRLLQGALEIDAEAVLFLAHDGTLRSLNARGASMLSADESRPRQARELRELSGPLKPAFYELLAFLSGLGDPDRAGVAPPERVVRMSPSSSFRIRGEVRFEAGMATGLVVRCREENPAAKSVEPDLGGWGLTPKEREIAIALLKGRDGEEICRSFGISRDTLKTHFRHLFEKTETRSRTQLVTRLFEARGA